MLAEAAKLRWSNPTELVDALQRQAVRALLTQAQDTGRLDEVEDQLFKVERLVAASPRPARDAGRSPHRPRGPHRPARRTPRLGRWTP